MKSGSELFEKKVLIVDDEEINREILGNIIESQYKVDFAKDGKEALSLILDLAEKGNEPDVVITDIVMPETDGLELIKL